MEIFCKIPEAGSRIRELNNEAAGIICGYLDLEPQPITKELIDQVRNDSDAAFGKKDSISEKAAFIALLTGFCGLDKRNNPKDAEIIERYFKPGIKKLDPQKYLNDPFFKTVKLEGIRYKNWEVVQLEYAPYELFVRDVTKLEDDFREIPQLGFFGGSFLYPSLCENGREWVALKPSEIESMESGINKVRGNVLTLGLGMGYFAFMAARKNDVKKVVVVEKSPELIDVFSKCILPQFPFREKIEIVCGDALEYAAKEPLSQKFDCLYADIWHDATDGTEPYLKLKEIERNEKGTKFLYWAEEAIISALRWELGKRF